MKISFLMLLFMFSTLAFSFEEEECEAPGPKIIPVEATAPIVKVNDALKKEFKRRPMPKHFNLALSIETNFTAPIVGKEAYWGRIYIREGNDSEIMYRDEQIAEDNYKKESKDPNHSPFFSTYSMKDINSPSGLSLIKAAGAEVNVKSVGTKFNGKTGGRLLIKVKAPGDKENNLTIDVVRNGSNISKFLIQGSKRIPFDSFKINASKNFFGVTSILNGIDDIQFMSGGKVVTTIKQ